MPSVALRAEAIAQLAASDGQPVTETWDDGVMYLFEAGPIVRPCISTASDGLYGLPAGLGANEPVPFQPVADGTVKAGFRYKISMTLGFTFDPREPAVTTGGVLPKLLHPSALDEVRMRFMKDWLIENLAPATDPTRVSMLPSTVTLLTGQVAYTQPWLLEGIAQHDMKLVADLAESIVRPVVLNVMGVYVQASAPIPNTPPQPTPVPPKTPDTTDGESSFGSGVLVALGVAVVGGTVWYGAKEGWFGNPMHKVALHRRLAA